MRTLLVIATLLIPQFVLAQRGGRGGAPPAQPVAPPNPGLECFDHLVTPDFPKAALMAHVDGSVWTTIQVGQGTAGKVDTQVVSAYGNGSQLLTPAVDKAVKASTFKSDCAGKTVSVVFRYQLYGEATAAPKTTTRNDPPNILWIESQPETRTATTASAGTKSGAKK